MECNNISERVAAIIEALNMKKVSFAERLKIDQSYVTQLTNGRRNPSDRLIASICREFNVNETWLRTGEGEMFTQPGSGTAVDRLCADMSAGSMEARLLRGVLEAYFKIDAKVRDRFVQDVFEFLDAHPLPDAVSEEERQKEKLLDVMSKDIGDMDDEEFALYMQEVRKEAKAEKTARDAAKESPSGVTKGKEA